MDSGVPFCMCCSYLTKIVTTLHSQVYANQAKGDRTYVCDLNILNKQPQAVNKGWPSSLRVGCGSDNSLQ
jgi:hypothetical protein